MDVSKQEYVHIQIHITEARRLLTILKQFDSDKIPDQWLKDSAREFIQQLEKADIKS